MYSCESKIQVIKQAYADTSYDKNNEDCRTSIIRNNWGWTSLKKWILPTVRGYFNFRIYEETFTQRLHKHNTVAYLKRTTYFNLKYLE